MHRRVLKAQVTLGIRLALYSYHGYVSLVAEYILGVDILTDAWLETV